MGLTISNIERSMWVNRRSTMFDIAFDSSYATGGETLLAREAGMSDIERLFIEPVAGYSFEYDHTNGKIKVYQPYNREVQQAHAPFPPIVYEEVVTVTTSVGYLKYPAAHIEYVTDDTTSYRVIPGGLVATTGQVAVDMGFDINTGVLTTGQPTKLTFLAADTVTSCKVSYITQSWKEVADNMVQACMIDGVREYGHADLTFTTATPDIVKLGEDFVALQSVCWNDGGTLTPMSALKDDGTVAAAQTECVVDFRKATTFGEIGFHQTDAVDVASTVYFNYIRDPGSGFLHDRFTNTEITDSSDTFTFTNLPLLYCTCGGLPMETTEKKCFMTGVGDTVAAGEGKWTSHPFQIGATNAIAPIITAHADTDDDSFPAIIVGHPSEIELQAVTLTTDTTTVPPVEIESGVDLSSLIGTIKVTAVGY